MRNSDDSVREALKALSNALGLMARHMRSTVDVEVIEEAFMALDYIRNLLLETCESASGQDKEQYIFTLTREAVSSNATDETVTRILLEFETIVAETGSALPIEKALYIFENGKLHINRLLIFLEDCYNAAPAGSEARVKMVDYLFSLLWRITR